MRWCPQMRYLLETPCIGHRRLSVCSLARVKVLPSGQKAAKSITELLQLQTSRPCLGAQKMEFRSRAVSEAIHEERNVVDFHGSEDMIGETIVALSSGSGRSGVAVIRISGPQADDAALALLKSGSSLPQARFASLRNLYDQQTGQLLDKALMLRFPGPASFTGEDVVELQGHGGPAVVQSLLVALTQNPNVRLADAGEFTRQAFMNGKLDLTEVEGIADLLAAETSAQHRQALQQTSGVQRRQYERWRKTLLSCLAHVEAVIDFGDDNDIDSGVAQEISPTVRALRLELASHLQDSWRGELLRDGIKVALVGPPNAGKSTLLNRLAGREAAIVSATPGTTRDALEVVLDLAGHKVMITDTAGLRETEDAIEAEGVARAQQAARNSNIVIAVADASDLDLDAPWIDSLSPPQSLVDEAVDDLEEAAAPRFVDTSWSRSSQEDFEVGKLPKLSSDGSKPVQKPVLLIVNKWDLVLSTLNQDELSIDNPSMVKEFTAGWLETHLFSHGQARGFDIPPSEELTLAETPEAFSLQARGASDDNASLGFSKVIGLSASTGQGLDLLLASLQEEITKVTGTQDMGEGYMITRLRHRQHVQECIESLRSYENYQDQPELASEELRYAAKALGKVTGAIGIEDVLDAIFSEFCVGK